MALVWWIVLIAVSSMDDSVRDALAKALTRPAYEVGAGIGYGRTYAPENYSNIDSHKTDTSSVGQAYALARNPYLGAEIGYMKLPEYHSRSHTDNYPAYKGLATGTYPQTVDGRQDITASSPYARLNLYGPTIMGAEPYGFYGRAKVNSQNHEHAVYNGTDEADLRQSLSRLAPYYGLGVNAPLSKNVNLRAEYGRIPHATVDYHTLDRDISMGLIGLGVKF